MIVIAHSDILACYMAYRVITKIQTNISQFIVKELIFFELECIRKRKVNQE